MVNSSSVGFWTPSHKGTAAEDSATHRDGVETPPRIGLRRVGAANENARIVEDPGVE
jgi:hypothetical protein